MEQFFGTEEVILLNLKNKVSQSFMSRRTLNGLFQCLAAPLDKNRRTKFHSNAITGCTLSISHPSAARLGTTDLELGIVERAILLEQLEAMHFLTAFQVQLSEFVIIFDVSLFWKAFGHSSIPLPNMKCTLERCEEAEGLTPLQRQH